LIHQPDDGPQARHLTGAQYAQKLGAAIGEPVRLRSVPYDVFRPLGVPAGDGIANVFQYYGDFDQEFTGARDLQLLREINPALKSFDEWLAENAAHIQVDGEGRARGRLRGLFGELSTMLTLASWNRRCVG